MKKILSLLVMLTLSFSIYAQDVIVKKDGTTIMAKVLTVSTTIVEYKKWTNQDGPTYVIETKELISINYANGDKEVFPEQKENPIATPVSTPAAPTYTQADIEQAVSRTTSQIVYKSTAGRGKIIAGGIILGVFALPSLAGGIIAATAKAPAAVSGTSIAVGALLTGVGWGLVSGGRSEKKEALGITQAPLLEHQFKMGDYALTPSVNVYSDKLTKKKGLGAGLAFNF